MPLTIMLYLATIAALAYALNALLGRVVALLLTVMLLMLSGCTQGAVPIPDREPIRRCVPCTLERMWRVT